MENSFNIRQEVTPLIEEVIQIRRELHQIPETAFKEIKTSSYVIEYLSKLKNIKIIQNVAITGVVGILYGKKDQDQDKRKCILLRADMDALPLTETTQLEFSSLHPGAHHGCGHDGHVAMLLVAAKILNDQVDQIKGDIKFCFQPAEEASGGARVMIQDENYPILKNPEVDYCYGIHLFTDYKLGTIVSQSEPMSCNSDRFCIYVKAGGGHASSPYKTTDAVYIGTSIANELYKINSRYINPVNPAVLVIGQIHGGSAANVISSECFLNGTIRTFYKQDQLKIKGMMEKICSTQSILHDCEVKFEFINGYPALVGTQEQSEELKKSASKIVGENNIHSQIVKLLIGEDYSFYLQEKPGAFMFLGAGIEGQSISHHMPNFTFNEQALPIGVSIWLQLVEDILF